MLLGGELVCARDRASPWRGLNRMARGARSRAVPRIALETYLMTALRSLCRTLTAGLLVLVASCASSDPVSPALLTELPRPLTDRERMIASTGNSFSFDLLRQV